MQRSNNFPWSLVRRRRSIFLTPFQPFLFFFAWREPRKKVCSYSLFFSVQRSSSICRQTKEGKKERSKFEMWVLDFRGNILFLIPSFPCSFGIYVRKWRLQFRARTCIYIPTHVSMSWECQRLHICRDYKAASDSVHPHSSLVRGNKMHFAIPDLESFFFFPFFPLMHE